MYPRRFVMSAHFLATENQWSTNGPVDTLTKRTFSALHASDFSFWILFALTLNALNRFADSSRDRFNVVIFSFAIAALSVIPHRFPLFLKSSSPYAKRNRTTGGALYHHFKRSAKRAAVDVGEAKFAYCPTMRFRAVPLMLFK